MKLKEPIPAVLMLVLVLVSELVVLHLCSWQVAGDKPPRLCLAAALWAEFPALLLQLLLLTFGAVNEHLSRGAYLPLSLENGIVLFDNELGGK